MTGRKLISAIVSVLLLISVSAVMINGLSAAGGILETSAVNGEMSPDFKILSPDNNSTIYDPTPTMVWEPAGEPTGAYLDFDGMNDYVGQSGVMADTMPVTISLWFKWTGIESAYDTLAGAKDANTSVVLRINSGAKEHPFGTYNWSSWSRKTPHHDKGLVHVGSAPTGTWTHLVAVAGPAGGENVHYLLYQDGELVAETIDIRLPPSQCPIWIGTMYGPHPYAERYFNGSIDDVRVYNRALSAGEVENLYNGMLVSDENLLAWWKFDEGSGLIAHDSSGNNNDGTIHGASWRIKYVAGIDHYEVRVDGAIEDDNIPPTATGYTTSPLSVGENHTFEVVAVKDNGDRVSSGTVKAYLSGEKHYEPNWDSLAQWTMPEWFENAVLGIYFHWGVYSVPAFGTEWYPRNMLIPGRRPPHGEDMNEYHYHCQKFGDPSVFGYKDFVPMFTAEKWDPDYWAELFENAGADFAGPVAIHHDGFAMWDSEYNDWNSENMGPHRDVAGEMAKAVREHGMKFFVSFHHGHHWAYYEPGYEHPDWDVSNPANCGKPQGLYPWFHERGTPRTKEFNDWWFNTVKEVIDKYQPDEMYFDFGFRSIPEEYRENLAAYYYNKAEELGRGFVMTQKRGEMPLSCSVRDHERSKLDVPTEPRWQTDISVDYRSWGYIYDPSWMTVDTFIDRMVDVTSKNGVTLLSLNPKADGTLPDEVVDDLTEIGRWMRINKVALYGAKPAPFVEGGADVAEAGTLRFTEKGDYLYAIETDEPKAGEVIPGVTPMPGSEIYMLGCDEPLAWHQEGNDVVIDELPDTLPCDYAWAYKIQVTEGIPPTPFDLISPENDAEISGYTPVLEWGASSDEGSGLDHYEVWIDNYNVTNVAAPSTSFISSALSKGTHEWYIVAVDKAGNKRKSGPFAFEVTGAVGPAEFVLSGLSVSKAEIEPGEFTVVSVLVTNTGGERGPYTVELKIDGETRTKEVTLDPGKSETVGFEVSMEDEGTYTVSAGTMTESIEVSAPEQPEGGGFPVVPVAAGVVAVVVVILVVVKRKARG